MQAIRNMVEEEQMAATKAWRAAQASEEEDVPVLGSVAEVAPALAVLL